MSFILSKGQPERRALCHRATSADFQRMTKENFNSCYLPGPCMEFISCGSAVPSPPASVIQFSFQRDPMFLREEKMSPTGCCFFFLLLPLATASCPRPCRCAANIVDCMSTELTDDTVPLSFPAQTTKLFLNNNYITFIPKGLFDHLPNLQVAHLRGNPWDCTCNILYLRSWLQWQDNRTLYRDVVCSTPVHLQGRIITYLSEDEIISTCQSWYCSVALIAQICLFVFILVQAVLLLLVIFYICRFQRIAKEARRTMAELYDNVEPWESSHKNNIE